MLDVVTVTDHIQDFSIEKKILGKYFNEKLSEKTTILLVWHKKIDGNFLAQYPSVRAIVRYGVGYDNIDIDYCKSKKIIVANTPDYGVDEVSDSALGMILYLTRKIGTLEYLGDVSIYYYLRSQQKIFQVKIGFYQQPKLKNENFQNYLHAANLPKLTF